MGGVFFIEAFKFAPGFSFVRGEGAVEAARPLVPRPVRIGGDQDELIGPLRIRKFQAVDSGRFAGFFPALGRIFEGVPV